MAAAGPSRPHFLWAQKADIDGIETSWAFCQNSANHAGDIVEKGMEDSLASIFLDGPLYSPAMYTAAINAVCQQINKLLCSREFPFYSGTTLSGSLVTQDPETHEMTAVSFNIGDSVHLGVSADKAGSMLYHSTPDLPKTTGFAQHYSILTECKSGYLCKIQKMLQAADELTEADRDSYIFHETERQLYYVNAKKEYCPIRTSPACADQLLALSEREKTLEISLSPEEMHALLGDQNPPVYHSAFLLSALKRIAARSTHFDMQEIRPGVMHCDLSCLSTSTQRAACLQSLIAELDGLLTAAGLIPYPLKISVLHPTGLHQLMISHSLGDRHMEESVSHQLTITSHPLPAHSTVVLAAATDGLTDVVAPSVIKHRLQSFSTTTAEGLCTQAREKWRPYDKSDDIALVAAQINTATLLPKAFLLAVADGHCQRGDVASQLIIRALIELMPQFAATYDAEAKGSAAPAEAKAQRAMAWKTFKASCFEITL